MAKKNTTFNPDPRPRHPHIASVGVLLLSLFPDFLDYLWSGRDRSDERESSRHRLSERDADNRASESDDRENRIGGSGDDHADVLRFMVLGRDLVRCSLSFDLRVERFLSHGDDPIRCSWLDPLVACKFVDGRQWGGTPLKGYLLDAFSRSIDS
jgi:hypothetical protein